MTMIYWDNVEDETIKNIVKDRNYKYASYNRKTKKRKYYLNLELSFDIETTSTIIQDNKVAFMYIWQFGLGENDLIVYGRTWEEFLLFLERLEYLLETDEEHIAIVYVHNLSYEFQFMKDYLKWNSVFAVDTRKPIKALSSFNIEFRDSYILSGSNLETVANNLVRHKIKKLVGDLDYKKIRTHDTILSDKELEYCENDVVIILYYINEQLQQYENDITKIPLTNTGRVRKYVSDKCYFTSRNHKKSSTGKYTRYRNLMEELTIAPDEYVMMKRAFQGGFTHANANKVNQVIENVSSDDFTSSYPTVAISEMYPMSKGIEIKVNSSQELDELSKKYCLIFDVKFTNIISKIHFEHYLSESKCYKLKGKISENGRIVKADSLITTITNVDYEIIKKCYEWGNIEIGICYKYYKGYLPKPIVGSILDFYQSKTELKDVKGKEVEYLVSKGMVNSIYGMMVTDIIQEENTYINHEWVKGSPNFNKQIEDYNSNKKRFLFYGWGIFITAYARRNLFTGILSLKDDYIYSDTDSVKYVNREKHTKYFEKYNEVIMMKLERAMKYHELDVNLLKPKTIKGVEKPLGVWDFEGRYDKFKTLGAKRYITLEDGVMVNTIAGLSKKNGLNYMLKKCDNDFDKVFEMFNDELYIPKEHTGKQTHTYIDDEKDFLITDYQNNRSEIHVKSGVHLTDCEFTLSLSLQYKEFLENLRKGYLYVGESATL